MTCREIDEALVSLAGRELPKPAQEHLASCEKCRNLVTAMTDAGAGYELAPGVLEQLRESIPTPLARVRPLAPAGVFVALILLVIAGAAMGGAEQLRVLGWPVLSPVARALIFGMLMILSAVAAFATAAQMRPGARTIRSGILFGLAFLGMEAVFFLVFHDYSLGRFFHWGMGCLRSGLLCAIPAGVLVWLLVRRGYVVAPVSAGSAIGAVAGLTGLSALELHCPILTIPHVAIWHVAVVAVSVALGALGGWLGSLVRERSAR